MPLVEAGNVQVLIPIAFADATEIEPQRGYARGRPAPRCFHPHAVRSGVTYAAGVEEQHATIAMRRGKGGLRKDSKHRPCEAPEGLNGFDDRFGTVHCNGHRAGGGTHGEVPPDLSSQLAIRKSTMVVAAAVGGTASCGAAVIAA